EPILPIETVLQRFLRVSVAPRPAASQQSQFFFRRAGLDELGKRALRGFRRVRSFPTPQHHAPNEKDERCCPRHVTPLLLRLLNLDDRYRTLAQTPRARGGADHAIAPVQALSPVRRGNRRLENEHGILLELPAGVRVARRARGNWRVIAETASMKQRPEHKGAMLLAPIDDELVQLADGRAGFKNL